MPQPLIAGLPPYLHLGAGCQIRLQALDPVTGNAVSGVNVSQVSIYVNNLTNSNAADLASGVFTLVSGAGG